MTIKPHSPLADRQPWRNRSAHHPHRPPDGCFHRRRLRRRRRRRTVRARGRHRHRLERRTSAQTYLDVGKVLDACRRVGADAVHPGLRFLVRERGLCANGDRRGHALGRPIAASHRANGRQAGRQAGHRRGRRADLAGHRTENRRGLPRGGQGNRLSGAGEGLRRRRRTRHESGGIRGRSGRGHQRRPARGRCRIRRRTRCSWSVG